MIKKKKMFQDEKELAKRKVKLDQLCDKHNLPSYMGELFLSELKLSTLDKDERAKQHAKLLGLM